MNQNVSFLSIVGTRK